MANSSTDRKSKKAAHNSMPPEKASIWNAFHTFFSCPNHSSKKPHFYLQEIILFKPKHPGPKTHLPGTQPVLYHPWQSSCKGWTSESLHKWLYYLAFLLHFLLSISPLIISFCKNFNIWLLDTWILGKKAVRFFEKEAISNTEQACTKMLCLSMTSKTNQEKLLFRCATKKPTDTSVQDKHKWLKPITCTLLKYYLLKKETGYYLFPKPKQQN